MEQTIGAKIRELRKARGLTQKELGERAGIAEPTIRRYELGKLNPKFETVQKIAKALNVPEAFFYPIDEQIETAKREAKSELWAAETLARDNGKPWDVPTYNQERERVILDMSRRYSVAPEILFAFIPQRTDDEYSKGAIYIDSTHEGSAKSKARNDGVAHRSGGKKLRFVSLFMNCFWVLINWAFARQPEGMKTDEVCGRLLDTLLSPLLSLVFIAALCLLSLNFPVFCYLTDGQEILSKSFQKPP